MNWEVWLDLCIFMCLSYLSVPMSAPLPVKHLFNTSNREWSYMPISKPSTKYVWLMATCHVYISSLYFNIGTTMANTLLLYLYWRIQVSLATSDYLLWPMICLRWRLIWWRGVHIQPIHVTFILIRPNKQDQAEIIRSIGMSGICIPRYVLSGPWPIDWWLIDQDTPILPWASVRRK